MPITHPKVNILEGGWYVIYNDGNVITMDEVSGWRALPEKKEIKTVGLKCRNKQYEISDKLWVPAGKTEMREISVSQDDGKIMVTRSPEVGWFVGYYNQDTQCKVIMRANKTTGKFVQEEVPYGEE